MSYRVYGSYVGRVRHSILRRPFRARDKYAPPAPVYDRVDYIAYLVRPSTIVLEPYYCVELTRGRHVYGAVTSVCTSIARTGMYYIPPDWCYTKYGGVFCDYVSTLIAPYVITPAFLLETSSIELDIRGLPTFREVTSYLVHLGRLPTAISNTAYDVLVAKPSTVSDSLRYSSLIALPHLIVSITGHKLELQALPRYSDTVDITVEVSPLTLVRFHGLPSVGRFVSVAFANVHVYTPTAVDLSYVSIDRAVAINVETETSVETYPTAVFVGILDLTRLFSIWRRNVTSETRTSYSYHRSFAYSSSYARSVAISADDTNVLTTSYVYMPARHTSVNLTYTADSADLVYFGYRLSSVFELLRLVNLYQPNVLTVADTSYTRLDHLAFQSAYQMIRSVELMYAPVVVVTSDRLHAYYAPARWFAETYTNVVTYPYRTVTSRYDVILHLYFALIAQANVDTYTYASVGAYRFADNLLQTTYVGYARIPHHMLRSRQDISAYLIFTPQSTYVTSYDAYSWFRYYQNVFTYTRSSVEVNAIRAYPVDVSYVAPSVVYVAPYRRLAGRLQRVAQLALTYPSLTSTTYTSTTVEYTRAYPIDVSHTSNTAVSVYTARHISSTTHTRTSSVLARYVRLTSNVLYSLLRASPVATETYVAYYVSVMPANVLQSDVAHYALIVAPANVFQRDVASYSLVVAPANVRHADLASYTVKMERYGSLQRDTSSYWLLILAPNVRHVNTVSYSLAVVQPNIRQEDVARYALEVLSPSVRQRNQSSYSLSVIRLMTLSMSADAGTTHVTKLYKVRTLSMTSDVYVSHATSLISARLELRGVAEVEYGVYAG